MPRAYTETGCHKKPLVPVSVVVDHQMNLQIRWHSGIHLFEKLEVLLVAMAVFAAGEYVLQSWNCTAAISRAWIDQDLKYELSGVGD